MVLIIVMIIVVIIVIIIIIVIVRMPVKIFKKETKTRHNWFKEITWSRYEFRFTFLFLWCLNRHNVLFVQRVLVVKTKHGVQKVCVQFIMNVKETHEKLQF